MKRVPAVVALSLVAFGGVAAPADAAVGLFSQLPTDPAPVMAPDTAEVRFEITGVGTDTSTPLKVIPTSITSPFTDPVDSVGLGEGPDRVRLVGTAGRLSTTSTAAAMIIPGCTRGGIVNTTWTTYRVDVPANQTVTIAVRVDVPKGLPGLRPSFTLDYKPLAEPGKVAPA